MKDYTVYFEIYGKKMKVTVKAFNEEGAKLIVKNQIKFHKVEDSTMDALKKTFGDIIDFLGKK